MGKDILVFIFSTTLLIIIFTFCLILSLSNFLTTDNIIKTVKESDFSSFYKDDNGNNTEVIDALELLLEKSNVPEEVVSEIVDSEPTKEFLGTYIGNSIENVINDKDEQELTSEDVVNLVDGNMSIIEKYAKDKGLELSDDTRNEILSLTEENSSILLSKMPNSKEIITMTGNDKINEMITLSKLLLSEDTKIAFLIAFGINVLFLILLRLKHNRWLKTLSAPFMISSFLLIAFSLLLKDPMKNYIANDSGVLNIVFSPIMDNLFSLIFKYGMFVLLISVAFLVIYNVQKRVFFKE